MEKHFWMYILGTSHIQGYEIRARDGRAYNFFSSQAEPKLLNPWFAGAELRQKLKSVNAQAELSLRLKT